MATETESTADVAAKFKSRGAPIEERFWVKVQKTETCWLWTGNIITSGYGHLYVAPPRRYVVAHRFAYELLVGPIPEGMVIDHLCRVRNCVNPAHLEPVTIRENTARGSNTWANAHRTGKCHRGHELTPGNYYEYQGRRTCKPCNQMLGRLRYQRRIALQAAAS